MIYDAPSPTNQPPPRDPDHYAKVVAHVHDALPTAIPKPTHLDPWGRLTAGVRLHRDAFYFRQDAR